MGIEIDTLTVDCAEPGVVGRFWAGALGWEIVDQDEAGLEIADPSGRDRPILFLIVPESKSVKNRWHLDLRPAVSMDAEIRRLTGIGASTLRRVDEGGSFWTVMADPEGNEFCILRGPEDGWSPE